MTLSSSGLSVKDLCCADRGGLRGDEGPASAGWCILIVDGAGEGLQSEESESLRVFVAGGADDNESEAAREGVLEGRTVLGAMLSLIAAPVDFTSLLPSALLPKQDAQFLSDWLCFALGIPRKPRHSTQLRAVVPEKFACSMHKFIRLSSTRIVDSVKVAPLGCVFSQGPRRPSSSPSWRDSK